MVTTVDCNNEKRQAIIIPNDYGTDYIESLKNAMYEVLECVVGIEEAKMAVPADDLYSLVRFIRLIQP